MFSDHNDDKNDCLHFYLKFYVDNYIYYLFLRYFGNSFKIDSWFIIIRQTAIVTTTFICNGMVFLQCSFTNLDYTYLMYIVHESPLIEKNINYYLLLLYKF